MNELIIHFRSSDDSVSATESDSASENESDSESGNASDSSSSLSSCPKRTSGVVQRIAFSEPDPVCERLNTLIKLKKIPKSGALYNHLADLTLSIQNPQKSPWSNVTLETWITLMHLGGERSVNFLRGPGYFDEGKGGNFKDKNLKINFGGPCARTLRHHKPGYTPKSGVLKAWLLNFISLVQGSDTAAVSDNLLEVYFVVFGNDGTFLKPALQFDEGLHLNIGLTVECDYEFIMNDPPRGPDLASLFVTEANVSSLSSINNELCFPVSVRYLGKAGKNGEAMQDQLEHDVKTVQMCEQCILQTEAVENVISYVEGFCSSLCDDCVEGKQVCDPCKELGYKEYLPHLRPCMRCIRVKPVPRKCVKLEVIALPMDCEAANKSAMYLMKKKRQELGDMACIITALLPDNPHIAKCLKCSMANWLLYIHGYRVCLSLLRTARQFDSTLRSMLTLAAVTNKDRMNWNHVVSISKVRFYKMDFSSMSMS